MSQPATTVRRRTRFLASLAALGLVTGLGALTAPTHAEESTETGQAAARTAAARASSSASIGAAATLKSTKRKKLRVGLSATKGGHLTVAISDNQGEQHIWSFKVPKKTLKVNGKGKGKLVTKKIKPYGKIKLKITPTKKWKKKTCKGKVIHKQRPLKIKGLFVFDTKSAWGRVGGKKVTFKGGQLIKLTGNDGSACFGGNGDGGDGDGGDACPPATASWAAYDPSGGLSSEWVIGAAQTTIVASRTANLSKPKGAVRIDSRSARVPTPTVTVAGTDATMVLKSGGPVTGSTTLTGTMGFALPQECAGGKTYEETIWAIVSQAHGATPLTMTMSALGSIRIPSTGTIIRTVSAAS